MDPQIDTDSFCVGCGSRLHRKNKRMEYCGLVCSKCFRLSHDKYVDLVDRIAKQRFEYVLEECAKLRAERDRPSSR